MVLLQVKFPKFVILEAVQSDPITAIKLADICRRVVGIQHMIGKLFKGREDFGETITVPAVVMLAGIVSLLVYLHAVIVTDVLPEVVFTFEAIIASVARRPSQHTGLWYFSHVLSSNPAFLWFTTVIVPCSTTDEDWKEAV